MPPGIHWCTDLSYPLHAGLEILHQFINSNRQHNIPGSENDPVGPVADHVEIDQFAVLGNCIRTGQKEVNQQCLTAELDLLVPVQTFFESINEANPRLALVSQ